MYYHPNDGKTAAPVITISTEAQSVRAPLTRGYPCPSMRVRLTHLTLTVPDLDQFMDTCLTSLVVLSPIPMSVEAPATGDASHMPRWMTFSNEKTRSSLAFDLLFSGLLPIIVPQRYRVSPGPHRPEYEE